MEILLLQTDVKWKDALYNRNHVLEMIRATSHADLIVLPEMFTTGFYMSPKEVAEQANAETLDWMKNVAKEKNAAIVGSVATVEDEKYYNRLYFVKPDGEFFIYNKRHLFTFGGEHKEYTAGEERVVVEYLGYKILLQICYDIRFPIFARNKGDYDMIIYIASWPTSRIEAWNTLLKARAIENVCYVVGVNRVGRDLHNEYSGGTALINYLGKPIVEAEWGREAAVSTSISKEDLIAFRKKFPALQDADEFTIIK